MIVDDNEGFRQQLRDLLGSKPDIEVIGDATNGREALQKTRELKPDLVLMDIRMPELNGLEATRLLKNEMPELKVIILTVFDGDEYEDAILASGANEYVIKRNLIEELIPAIWRTVQVIRPKHTASVISGRQERNGK